MNRDEQMVNTGMRRHGQVNRAVHAVGQYEKMRRWEWQRTSEDNGQASRQTERAKDGMSGWRMNPVCGNTEHHSPPVHPG